MTPEVSVHFDTDLLKWQEDTLGTSLQNEEEPEV